MQRPRGEEIFLRVSHGHRWLLLARALAVTTKDSYNQARCEASAEKSASIHVLNSCPRRSRKPSMPAMARPANWRLKRADMGVHKTSKIRNIRLTVQEKNSKFRTLSPTSDDSRNVIQFHQAWAKACYLCLHSEAG